MSHSPALGTQHEIDLPGGRIRYHETGDGPPVVFVHGLLVNADLWRGVVGPIAAHGYRCIAPDWPFGAHEIPVPDADLTPTGAADLIADFLDALQLRDVTLVANDTGGGVTQVLMSRNHSRVGRVILTPSDCYDYVPPILVPMLRLARFRATVRAMVDLLRVRPLQRLPMAFGWVAKRPIPREFMDSYLLPSRSDAGIRDDVRRLLTPDVTEYTTAAARTFGQFTKPVLLVWAREDKMFPARLAQRLAHDLPNATLKWIEDSYTFIPEDQPELLAETILEFTQLHAQT